MKEEKELFDTSPYGHFYVPAEIVHFLIDLTDPRPGERVLGIGVIDPKVLGPAVEARTDAEPEYVKGYPTPEKLGSLAEQYSVILCAPPFGLSFDQDPDRPGEPSEEFWLKWSVGRLSRDGRLAVIVPAGLLSNYSQQPIRRFLLEKAGLQAILELSAGWAPSTATQASILFITSDCEPSRPVKMIRFTDAGAIPWSKLVPYILALEPALPQETSGKAYAVPASDLNSLRLDAQYYDPKYTLVQTPDPAVFEAVNLAKLVEIRSGQRFSKGDWRVEGIPFIQVGNIKTDGHLALRNARTIVSDVAMTSRGYSQHGDILITVAGTVGKVAFLGDETPATGVCIDTSLRRLRVLDEDRVLPEYLALYLRSELAQLQIERFGSGSVIRILSSPNLGEIKVYLPDLPRQREIVETFYRPTPQQIARFFFLDAEQMPPVPTPPTEQLPLPQPPTWQEVVKAQFPFPIARAYTVFEDEAGHSPSSRLKALIDVSEAVVYYLYGILVSDQLRRLRISDDDLRSKLVTSYHIGRRIEFIFYMQKLAREDRSVAFFVPELIDVEVGICMDINKNLRNKYSHLIALPDPRCEQVIARYEPKLEALLRSLMPIKAYTLAQVTGFDIRAGLYQHYIVPMIGNNRLFQSQVEDLESLLDVTDTKHIVLITPGYDVLDLHPFYLRHAWESTGFHNHLCVFKQVEGSPPNQRLLVESTEGVGETYTETDLGLNDLLTTGTT